MKTKFKFLAAITLAMGLFSCSNDEGLDNTTPGGQGILGNAETYATIRIAMPGGAGLANRTIDADPESGHGTEVGTENENKFHDITLYFFDGYDKTSTCKGVLTMEGSKFSSQAVEGNTNVVYTTNNPIKVGIEGDDMRVYAVMNGSVSGAGQGITLEKFLGKTVNTDAVFNTDNTKFLMTSRTPTLLSLSSEKNNTEKDAASLNVSVERTAAKICYKAQEATNTYSVLSEKDPNEVVASVTLNGYKLVNLRNDAYYFRKVAGADGNWLGAANFGSGVQEKGNYVIDPYFTEKTVDAANKVNFVTEWFGADKAYAENTISYTELPVATNEHQLLAYCMENTTTQNAQLNGYSTGIIFKATYAPKEVYVFNQGKNAFEAKTYEAGTTFYRYGNVLYKDKEEVKSFYGLTDEALIETFTGDKTSGATCYYKYWIRHMDNGNAEQMDAMEFAIVRNNAYKLDVKTVSGLGEPNDEIDPNIPDESSKMYLNVEVKILPWVVRNNNDIIL